MTLEIVGEGEKPVPVEDVELAESKASEDDDEEANDSELNDLLDQW